jgi:serine protease Do
VIDRLRFGRSPLRLPEICCQLSVVWFGLVISLSTPAIKAQIPPAPRPDEDFVVKQPLFTSKTPENKLSLETGLPPTSPSLSIGRNSIAIREALLPVARPIADSVIEIIGEFERTSLGTIITSDGLVVAKHSELSERFECRLTSGEIVAGRLIGIHPRDDLALIQIEANQLSPVKLHVAAVKNPGTFVVSVGFQSAPVSLGAITTHQQYFDVRQPENSEGLDLGVSLGSQPVNRQFKENGAVKLSTGRQVTQVRPRTPAEKSGLLVGDTLLSINGDAVMDDSSLNEIAKTIRIGQTLDFEILRDQKRRHFVTKILRLTPRTIHDRWGGGPFSERRFGFQNVIAHDSILAPEQCGGPLATLTGDVIGINISRSMRVASFAIPAQRIVKFVRYVRPKAKLVLNESNSQPISARTNQSTALPGSTKATPIR